MLSVPDPKQCVPMQLNSQNTWNKHIPFFFSSLKIRNFGNYCPSAVSRFRSERKTQWTLLPKPSNNFSFWMTAGDCLSRKLLSFYLSIVLSVSCLRLDLIMLIKGIRRQFRIGSQNWLSTKQFWGVLVKIHTEFHHSFLLRDYF